MGGETHALQARMHAWMCVRVCMAQAKARADAVWAQGGCKRVRTRTGERGPLPEPTHGDTHLLKSGRLALSWAAADGGGCMQSPAASWLSAAAPPSIRLPAVAVRPGGSSDPAVSVVFVAHSKRKLT